MSAVASSSPVWASEEEQWNAPVNELCPEAITGARERPAENGDPLPVADVAVFALGPKLIERP